MSEEVALLSSAGPTAEEMERGLVQAESQFMFRLQSVGGFGGKSDQLNAYNTFLDDPDPFINPAGVKGVGEIGITGVAAAISDAVWHATGKRLRHTPILAEALLED